MIALPRIPPEVMSKLRAYWRRRWVVLGVAWPLALVGWVGVMLLPDRYECMTRIFADTDNLLTPLLRNITVQSDLEKQLDVIERTLLNHNNLVAVAHSADLDLDAIGAHLQRPRVGGEERQVGLGAVREQRGQRGGQRHQPVGLDAGLAGIAAPMGFTHPPAGQDHLVAGLV